VVIARAQKTEEEMLFPALRDSGMPEIESALSNLQMDHTGDICFAEELSEVLLAIGKGSPLHDAEATGYMLRGFFESLRRHIAFEEQLAAGLRQKAGRTGPNLIFDASA
jgi:hemerythrin-like domain-containing protein